MTWQVRVAAEADAEAMLRIDEAASPVPWPQSQLRKACRAGADTLVRALVAECGHELCGFLLLSTVVDEATIHNLVVLPSRQRQGVAAALMEATLSRCRGCGVQRLMLEVRVSNVAAINLYQRFGFIEDGVRKDYYPAAGGRENALLMSRQLGVSA